jgi:hypothetical protein
MLKIRCLACNTEVQAKPGQSSVCKCSNMATIRGDSVSAVDLSQVVIISGTPSYNQPKAVLSSSDLMWQEERKKRGVKKLSFEER